MNLFTKQKENQRGRKQTYGYQRGKWGEGGIHQEVGNNRCKPLYIHKRDKQQGPTAQHRELYSISCNNLKWNRSWERTDIHTCIAESLGYTPSGSDGKESAYNARDLGSIPGLDKSPGEGNGYPLQYSCMENSMDRESWWATVHGITRELDMTEQ